jgi:hypothetical protein
MEGSCEHDNEPSVSQEGLSAMKLVSWLVSLITSEKEILDFTSVLTFSWREGGKYSYYAILVPIITDEGSTEKYSGYKQYVLPQIYV